jgi:putative hydrolase of the HAD superfamily
MVGNSLKSDVLPLIEIGAKAIHIPYHTTWAHEIVKHNGNSNDFRTVAQLDEILNFL